MNATPFTVLYHDEHLVAVHKPPGYLVHRSDIDRHETRILMPQLRDQIGLKVYPVHRLDKPTAGIMVFALDPDTARTLVDTFAAHRVRKEYHMIVRGWPYRGGIIRHALTIRDDHQSRQSSGTAPAQPACTVYQRLATSELPVAIDLRYPSSRFALLRARPITGRRHQLRRHMKHISHPIIGDSTYGKGRHNRYLAQELEASGLLLCATRLALSHPHTGEPLLLKTSVPSHFSHALDALGLPGVEC